MKPMDMRRYWIILGVMLPLGLVIGIVLVLAPAWAEWLVVVSGLGGAIVWVLILRSEEARAVRGLWWVPLLLVLQGVIAAILVLDLV